MKRMVRLFALPVLIAELAGCLNQAGFERAVASRVHPGMKKDDVVSSLGELRLSCVSGRRLEANGGSQLDCSRSRPRILDGCVQRVYIDVSAEGGVSGITVPKAACAGL
jgi:hypothetical protein